MKQNEFYMPSSNSSVLFHIPIKLLPKNIKMAVTIVWRMIKDSFYTKKSHSALSVIPSILLCLFLSLPPIISLSLSLCLSLLGTRKLEYAGSTWHEGCFICHSCEQPIGSKSFIPDKDEHYCVSCYEDKFAPRCTRCKKVCKVIK